VKNEKKDLSFKVFLDVRNKNYMLLKAETIYLSFFRLRSRPSYGGAIEILTKWWCMVVFKYLNK